MAGRVKDEPEQGEVPTKAICDLLEISSVRLGQLVAEGHVPKNRIRNYWHLATTVQAYIRYLKHERGRSSITAQEGAVKTARAAEINQRIAEKNRTLIPMDDAKTMVDSVVGSVVRNLDGFPAMITRDRRERKKVELAVDALRNRICADLDKAIALARSGEGDPEAEGSANA